MKRKQLQAKLEAVFPGLSFLRMVETAGEILSTLVEMYIESVGAEFEPARLVPFPFGSFYVAKLNPFLTPSQAAIPGGTNGRD
jgi:hypothetical protein